ncbi:MAG: M28 family peptidase [Caldithrix sp.]|nr:M28 family peptidase [Caldithrix sp.]
MKKLYLITVVTLMILMMACTPNGPDTDNFDQAARVADDVQTTNLMPWVEQLASARLNDTPVDNEGFSSKDLFPSDHLTRNAAVGIISQGFKSMGYQPDTIVLTKNGQTTYNVVVEWPGTTRPEEVVLVGSHLDGFYAAADDNGSAIAAMLETARAVRNHNFARTIRFVSFDLEEFGAIGSTRYVEAGYADDVYMAIVMDMIGYATDEPDSQDDVMGVKLPDTGDFLLVVGNNDSAEMTEEMIALGNSSGKANLVGLIAPGDGSYFLASAFMRSDHGLLWYQGIPALLLTDTGNFRNKNYHKATDLPETLNPDFLAANTKALAAAVALFAEVL